MKGYRIYCLDETGRVNAPAEEKRAESDNIAIQIARDLCHPHGVEVWQGKRLVGKIEPNKLAG